MREKGKPESRNNRVGYVNPHLSSCYPPLTSIMSSCSASIALPLTPFDRGRGEGGGGRGRSGKPHGFRDPVLYILNASVWTKRPESFVAYSLCHILWLESGKCVEYASMCRKMCWICIIKCFYSNSNKCTIFDYEWIYEEFFFTNSFCSFLSD